MSANTKNAASITITLDIYPSDAKGNRKLIVSGAPRDEMPTLRAGLFAERHKLLDEIWIALQKRKPQVVKKSVTARAAADAKQKPADDDDENASTETIEQGDGASEEKFAQAVNEAKSEIENDKFTRDQLVAEDTDEPRYEQKLNGEPSAEFVNAVGAAWEQSALPLIENDPTQAEVLHG